MRREILEIPRCVAGLLDGSAGQIAATASAIERRTVRWVAVAGRGTSDHAATYARYLVETQLGLPAALAAPSVATLYRGSIDWRDGLLVAISQSGRSPDVVGVTRAARAGGALTIAVVNDAASPLAATAETVIELRAGVEASVAATKTYVAQLVAIAALVARLRPASALAAAVDRLPATLAACLVDSEAWLAATTIADELASTDRALVVSRGHNLATALEVALKLKEAAGLFADGYSMADLLHGPIALAGPDVPVLVFRPDGPVGASLDEGIERLADAGARPWLVGGRDLVGRGEAALALPLAGLPEPLSPVALVLPGQLLAESVARQRGRDPDRPPGLAKVTLTR